MIFRSFSVVSRAGWGSEDMPLKGVKMAGAREKGFYAAISSPHRDLNCNNKCKICDYLRRKWK